MDLDIVERKTISVIVDYTIKNRVLNLTTVNYVANIKLIDGDKTKDHWCNRFLVPIIKAFSMSFHDFLKQFFSESPKHRFCFKRHRRFWADNGSNHNWPTRFSSTTKHKSKYFETTWCPKASPLSKIMIFFTVKSFVTTNQILQCVDIRTNTKICEPQKIAKYLDAGFRKSDLIM